MATPDMDPKAKGTPPTTPLEGADQQGAPGQPPDTVAKQSSEPNRMEQQAGEKAQREAQKASDDAAKQAAKVARGEAAPTTTVADVPDEQAAVAAFAEKKGFNGAESGLLRAILQARRDGTQVPSVHYNSVPEDRIAAVAEASDEYVEKRSKSAIRSAKPAGKAD